MGPVVIITCGHLPAGVLCYRELSRRADRGVSGYGSVVLGTPVAPCFEVGGSGMGAGASHDVCSTAKDLPPVAL